MARQSDPELRDIMALYSMFGPQAQQERAQQAQGAQLQQLTAMTNLANAPAEQALKLRAAEADIGGREATTAGMKSKLPLELQGLQAGIDEARAKGRMSEEQYRQLQTLFPIALRGEEAKAKTAELTAKDLPEEQKRKALESQTDIGYKTKAGKAAELTGLATMMEHAPTFYQTLEAMAGNAPDALKLALPGIFDSIKDFTTKRAAVTKESNAVAARPKPTTPPWMTDLFNWFSNKQPTGPEGSVAAAQEALKYLKR